MNSVTVCISKDSESLRSPILPIQGSKYGNNEMAPEVCNRERHEASS